MQATSRDFKANAHRALRDPTLQGSLGIMMREGFAVRRAKAADRLPEFEALRDEAKALKDHVLENLDFYLERFERNVAARGGEVHWCRTADEARAAVLAICRAAGARTVTKGKSMVGEEIAINEHLEANGIKPVETDLGEYIIQIRHEPPSHIVAPAVHLAKEQVAESFRATHRELDPARPLDEPQQMVGEARAILRRQFLAADVGITGANFLVAETGSSIIVTNEGNGDLTQTLPGVHIVLASIEKVVPTLEDASLAAAASRALGDGAGIFDLHHGLDRPAPPRRSRRAGRLSRHPARQRAQRAPGRRDAGHAALYQMRGVPQSLPGLWCDRRPRLWLGLSGADGRGADADAHRHRGGGEPPQRLDLLRRAANPSAR